MTASATPEWRVGDNWPPISGTIVDGAGNPVDVSGASSLTFKSLSGSNAVTGTATNLDDGTTENRGKWSYTWADDDLSVAGSYGVLIAVEWTADQLESFPSNEKAQPTYVVTANNDAPVSSAVDGATAAKPRRSLRAAV